MASEFHQGNGAVVLGRLADRAEKSRGVATVGAEQTARRAQADAIRAPGVGRERNSQGGRRRQSRTGGRADPQCHHAGGVMRDVGPPLSRPVQGRFVRAVVERLEAGKAAARRRAVAAGQGAGLFHRREMGGMDGGAYPHRPAVSAGGGCAGRVGCSRPGVPLEVHAGVDGRGVEAVGTRQGQGTICAAGAGAEYAARRVAVATRVVSTAQRTGEHPGPGGMVEQPVVRS